jgi:hypothetical protein
MKGSDYTGCLLERMPRQFYIKEFKDEASSEE